MAQQPEVKATLGLTGATMNAMALIAPGAFLWITYQLQAAATAPSVENASGPVTSAVQNDEYPNPSAVRATSSAAAGPSACSGANVTPRVVGDDELEGLIATS